MIHLGFCFGKLSIDSIVEVNDLTITYQYKIENVPEWAPALIGSFFDKPLDQLQQTKATFSYNRNNQLISLSSDYSYYFDAELSQ